MGLAADDDETDQMNYSNSPHDYQEVCANALRFGSASWVHLKCRPGPSISLLKKDPRPIDFIRLFTSPGLFSISQYTFLTNRYTH